MLFTNIKKLLQPMWILVEEVDVAKMAALVMRSLNKCLGWTIKCLKGINVFGSNKTSLKALIMVKWDMVTAFIQFGSNKISL